MNGPVPAWMLRELGRAEGGPCTLHTLLAGQHRRRLLLLRLLLDAVRRAPPAVLAPSAAALAREHWALLEEVDLVAPEAARAALYYPLVGPWAESCVRALSEPPGPTEPTAPTEPTDPAGLTDHTAPSGPTGPAGGRPDRRVPAAAPPQSPAAELAHLGGLAVAAAARATHRFRTTLVVRDGVLALPTLGVLRLHHPAPVPRSAPAAHRAPHPLHGGTSGAACPPSTPRPRSRPYAPAGTAVWVRGGDGGVLTVTGAGPHAGPPVVLRPDGHGGWRSDDARWRPTTALEGAPHRVLLDDGDPYRAVDNELLRYGLFTFGTLTPAEREQWRTTWRAALPMLAATGQRPLVDTGLLGCLVPMTRPPDAAPRDEDAAHSSGTRREAFGAVLASVPSGPAGLAATLVHELHHAKLSAVSDLTPLHTAGSARRYWAPWRPDPRPFDGLLQGAYAHLALAGYWHRVALAPVGAHLRDLAWAEHARCREQVGAILPTLCGSHQLTSCGRVLIGELAALHARMKREPPPARYLARATAYVETARLTWRRQHAR